MTMKTGGPGRSGPKLRRGLVVLGLLCALLGPRAWADDVKDAEAAIREGVKLRQAGQDVHAMPLFQKAYQLERTPRSAGQLGLCELALGYWVDAEKHLDEALAAASHPWVSNNRAALKTAVKQAHANVGEVRVTGEPADAEILVDGKNVGRLPLPSPLRLGKGPHDVAARATGFEEQVRSLAVMGGDTQVVAFKLPAVAALPAPPPVASVAPVVPVVAPSAPEPEASSTRSRRTLAWVGAGAAAVALVVGVVETTRWIGKLHDFDNHEGPLASGGVGTNCGSGDAHYGGAGCSALHDDLSSARTWTIVGYGVGAALGVGSAVLFATSTSNGPQADVKTAWTCAPDVLGKTVSCRWSF
jgi:PEGA domain